MGAFAQNFMGHSPVWYKIVIVTCLCINPILRVAVSKESAAWALLIEFVFTLFMVTMHKTLLTLLALVVFSPCAPLYPATPSLEL